MSTTPSTFHLFPQLPPELRNQIYTLALPDPILHEITPTGSSDLSFYSSSPTKSLRFTSPRAQPPPSLAAVSREARALTLHIYKPLTLCGGTTKYLDPARDMLLLEASLTGRELLRALAALGRIPLVREALRGLALGTSWGVHSGIWHVALGWGARSKGGGGGSGGSGNSVGKLVARLAGLEKLERLVFLVKQEVQVEATMGLPAPKWEDETNGAVCGGMLSCPAWSRASFVDSKKEEVARTDDGGSSRASSPGTCSESTWSSSSSVGDDGSDSTMLTTNFYRLSWMLDRPCTRHENELSYYPPPPLPAEDAKEDDENQIIDQERPRLLCGLTPSQDDWLRFQKAFRRQLEAGLAHRRAGNRAMPARQVGKRTTVGGEVCGSRKRKREREQEQEQCSSHGSGTAEVFHTECKRLRTELAQHEDVVGRLPAIEGANVLWRYSLPASTARGH